MLGIHYDISTLLDKRNAKSAIPTIEKPPSHNGETTLSSNNPTSNVHATNHIVSQTAIVTTATASDNVTHTSELPVKTSAISTKYTRKKTLQQLCFQQIFPPLLVVVAIVGFWQWGSTTGRINPLALPAPTSVATSMLATWDSLWTATVITSYEAITGFILAVILGVAVGIALFVSQAFYAATFPLLVAAQTMPLITIAPLFLIWFGFEPSGKIAVVTVFTMFPIALATCRGLLQVPQYYTDVALTCGAGKLWTMVHVQLRGALRQIFSGIRIAAAYVFATATTAEYLGARGGLGIFLQAAFNSFRTPLILAATCMIVILTGMLLGSIAIVERMWIGKAEDDDMS